MFLLISQGKGSISEILKGIAEIYSVESFNHLMRNCQDGLGAELLLTE